MLILKKNKNEMLIYISLHKIILLLINCECSSKIYNFVFIFLSNQKRRLNKCSDSIRVFDALDPRFQQEFAQCILVS